MRRPHKSTGRSAPSHFKPRLWRREIKSMWSQWMPRSRSAIWWILGACLLFSGLHHSPRLNLVLSEKALLSMQLWTPLTTGWVLAPATPLFSLLLLAFVAAFKSGAMTGQVKRPRYFGYAIGAFFFLLVIDSILPSGLIWALCTEGLMLIWFGQDLERYLGRKTFAYLSASLLVITYLLAALFLFLFSGAAVNGIMPLSRAMILAWGHLHGSAHLSFLNIKANQLRWVVYAFCGFELLLFPLPLGLTNLSAVLLMDLWLRRRGPLGRGYVRVA